MCSLSLCGQDYARRLVAEGYKVVVVEQVEHVWVLCCDSWAVDWAPQTDQWRLGGYHKVKDLSILGLWLFALWPWPIVTWA